MVPLLHTWPICTHNHVSHYIISGVQFGRELSPKTHWNRAAQTKKKMAKCKGTNLRRNKIKKPNSPFLN